MIPNTQHTWHTMAYQGRLIPGYYHACRLRCFLTSDSNRDLQSVQQKSIEAFLPQSQFEAPGILGDVQDVQVPHARSSIGRLRLALKGGSQQLCRLLGPTGVSRPPRSEPKRLFNPGPRCRGVGYCRSRAFNVPMVSSPMHQVFHACPLVDLEMLIDWLLKWWQTCIQFIATKTYF